MGEVNFTAPVYTIGLDESSTVCIMQVLTRTCHLFNGRLKWYHNTTL